MTAASAPATRRRPPGRFLAVAAVGIALLALTACGSSSTQAAGSAAAPAGDANTNGSAPEQLRDGALPGKAAGPSRAGGNATAAGSGSSAGSTATAQARLIRTAQVTVEVNGPLNTATELVRQIATQFGGHVDSETTGYTGSAEQKTVRSDGNGASTVAPPGESLIVLRIPQPKLDDAIKAVTGELQRSKGGKVVSRTSSTQDVTGDIADLTSRVASKKASLERVRALMARATSLQDVVSLESELANRESDLEALESRLAALSDRADLSTLTVLLRPPAAAAAPETSDSGFLGGLKSGWHALQVSTTAVLTVLGALLPIAVVVALLGWPALVVLRRRQARAGTAAALPPSAGRPFGGRPGPEPGGPGGPGGPKGPADDGCGDPAPGEPGNADHDQPVSASTST